MKRKATLHRKQKSQDVTSRRSALKSSKSRDERAPTTSPTTLPWDIEFPKGIRELLINNRTQIKQKGMVLKIPKEYKYQNPELERRPNVKETLEQFANYLLHESGKSLNQPVQDESLIPVITRGLLEERGQYAFLDNKFRTGTGATIDEDEDALITLTSWYGADHLLRLIGGWIKTENASLRLFPTIIRFPTTTKPRSSRETYQLETRHLRHDFFMTNLTFNVSYIQICSIL
ncbi:1474_t:CDS:2 [Acaulospora colombiana]|uniref:1474_t:CDS:1 n=1 Tax=Acaulospora colombiana TaxID=27376 RepID=A0ACA9NMG5_9GLOM|nr:1474_t:CDS:2 [Acaulospora colombiana]